MQNDGHQRRNNAQRNILRGLIDRGDKSTLFIGEPLDAQATVGRKSGCFNGPHHQTQEHQHHQRTGKQINSALKHSDDRPANQRAAVDQPRTIFIQQPAAGDLHNDVGNTKHRKGQAHCFRVKT